MSEEPTKSIEEIIREDGRYPPEAYAFLDEALQKAVREVHGEGVPPSERRHVTGQQLCESLRQMALRRWGALAKTVLARWNIHATIDFGNMVYLLIQHGVMRKTESDSIEDFRDVYDFDEAFRREENFELKE